MSAGRGARKSRQAVEEVTTPISPQCCTYSERLCQRPITNTNNNLCWAHSKAAEAAPSGKSRKSGSSTSHQATVPLFVEAKMPSKKELSDQEKLKRLITTYVAASEVSDIDQQANMVNTNNADPSSRFDYLEAIGSINVDDPTAPVVEMEDSTSDAGSDEFGSAVPLDHAGKFSAEEMVSLACDKMQTLRRLYVEELKQIGVQLKLSRRRYLNEVARDRRRRIGDPLTDYVAITPEQQQSRRILKAMRRHRRRYPSADNVLRWSLRSKLHQKRLQSASGNLDVASPSGDQQLQQQPHPQLQITSASINRHCAVTSCEENILPLTKYCSKHILLDRRQLLFSKCPGFVITDCVEKVEERTPSSVKNDSDLPSTPLAVKSHQIECGRLAVQGPSLLRGLASSSPSASGRTGTASPLSTAASPALCSTHRTLVLMSSPASKTNYK